MINSLVKVLAVSSILVATGAFAQATGTTGSSGVSGGIGSDFAASNVAGANSENGGGFANAVENAFKDEKRKN